MDERENNARAIERPDLSPEFPPFMETTFRGVWLALLRGKIHCETVSVVNYFRHHRGKIDLLIDMLIAIRDVADRHTQNREVKG